ncbi:hypothetical protein F5Y14DRAFT_349455 [Nemania sp. NC0429]|nr:hypothetical protein F5Y14DRAFT_349455 [Nemania sp. NC0429]
MTPCLFILHTLKLPRSCSSMPCQRVCVQKMKTRIQLKSTGVLSVLQKRQFREVKHTTKNPRQPFGAVRMDLASPRHSRHLSEWRCALEKLDIFYEWNLSVCCAKRSKYIQVSLSFIMWLICAIYYLMFVLQAISICRHCP